MLRKLAWMAFAIVLVVVVLLSVIPASSYPNMRLPEIVGHLAAYMALALIGGIACRTVRSLYILAASLVFIGVALEFVQALLPSRNANGHELLANIFGVALGSAVAVLTNLVRNRHSRTIQ